MFKPEHINKDFPYYEKLIRLIKEEEKLRERDRSGIKLIFLSLIGFMEQIDYHNNSKKKLKANYNNDVIFIYYIDYL